MLRWYEISKKRFQHIDNYVHGIIIAVLVIFSAVTVLPIIIPQMPENYESKGENFTIHYTVKNLDSDTGSLMRATERLQFRYTIESNFPESVSFDYKDAVSFAGQQVYSSFLNNQSIPTNGQTIFTSTIPLEKSGLNIINATITFNKHVHQPTGQFYWINPFLEKISTPPYVKRVYSQSEYDARIISGVTFVLVLATVYYAFQTRKTVRVLKETREAEFLPYIIPTISYLGPVAIVLQIINIGKGGAKELEIKYRIKEIEKSEKIWHQNLLRANQSQVFYLKDENNKSVFNIDFFENKQFTLVVDASYKDIFEKLHTNTNVIDVTKFVKQFKVVSAQYKEETSEQIARSLEKMADALGSSKSDVNKMKDLMDAQVDINRLDFQISVVVKKIDDLSLDEPIKKKIRTLIDDLAIIMREEPIALEKKRLVSILKEIYTMNKDVIQIIKDTLLSLKYWIRYSPEGEPME